MKKFAASAALALFASAGSALAHEAGGVPHLHGAEALFDGSAAHAAGLAILGAAAAFVVVGAMRVLARRRRGSGGSHE